MKVLPLLEDRKEDFPGATVDGNSPANAEYTGLSPGLGKSTCPGATKPESTTTEPACCNYCP